MKELKNRLKIEFPRLRKKTKKLSVILLVAFVAIVSGLTISSVILNEKEITAAPYNGLHDDTEANQELTTLLVSSLEDISDIKAISDDSLGYDKVGNQSYIVNYSSHEDAEAASEVLAAQNVSADMDFVFHITAEDEVIAEDTITYTSYAEEYASGKTLRQIADETGKKLVAIIDTGVNDYATASVNFTEDSDEDVNGHGTNMARTILEFSDDNAIILSLKAMNDDGTGTMSQVYRALQYAKEANVDIINLSISAYDNDNSAEFKALVEKIVDDGITVVSAAGNYSSNVNKYIPANIDGVIVAGTANLDGYKEYESNYGDVDYYENASSTSEAAAMLVGQIVAEKDLSLLYTKETIKIKSQTVCDQAGQDLSKINGFAIQANEVRADLTINWNTGNSNTARIYSFETSYPSSQHEGNLTMFEYIDISLTNCTETSVTININHQAGFKDSRDWPYYMSQQLDWKVDGTVVYQSESSSASDYYKYNTEWFGGSWNYHGYSGNKTWTYSFVVNNLKPGEHKISADAIYKNSEHLDGHAYGGKDYDYYKYAYFTLPDPTRTLTINPNGGTWNGTSSNSARSIRIGNTYDLGTPSRSGGATVTLDYNNNFADNGQSNPNSGNVVGTYKFTGWSITSGNSTVNGNVVTMGNSNSTVTASWGFNSVQLPSPSKSGYSFSGWYDINGNWVSNGGPYTPGGNITLYAHWTRNSYSLDVNAVVNGTSSGGLSDPNTGKTVGTFDITVNGSTRYGVTDYCENVPYYSSYSIYNVTSAAGYKYAGSTGSATSGNTPAYAISVALNYVGIDYTVRFDSNCSKGDTTPYPIPNSDLTEIPTGSMSNISARYGTYTTIPSNGYSWAGHTFLGWSTDPDATSATYQSGSSYVLDLTTTENSTVTLYAVWKPNSVTMKVDPNGGTWNGSGSTQSFIQTWGTTKDLGTATAPARQSVVSFDLNIDLNDTNPDNIDAPHSETPESVTLQYIFDKWTVQSGGKGWMDGNVYTYQSTADTVTANYYFQNMILPVPTREGFTFLGWYYEPECLTKAGNGNAEYRPTNDTETLYARWQKNTFNYKDTITAYMEDASGERPGQVLIRKIDEKGNILEGVTTVSGREYAFVLEVYRGTSLNSSNKVLTLNTLQGLYDSSGIKIQNKTSDPDGWYDITAYLTEGQTYTIHEAEAAAGYSIAEDQTFVYESGDVIQLEVVDYRRTIAPPPGSENNPMKKDQYGREVSAAIFELKDLTKNEVIGEYVTDKKGNFPDEMFSEMIAGHQYALTETEAPEGFDLAPTFYITVPESGIEPMPTIEISETAVTKNLEIIKVNSDDEPLSGAEFTLYTKDENGDLVPCLMNKTTGSWTTEESSETVTMTSTTDRNGRVTFRNLPLRASYTGSEDDFTKSYYLVETKAPEGYNRISTVMEIRLEDISASTLTYTVKDGSVTLTLEAGGTGTKLAMIGGVIVVIGAAIYLMQKKKKK